MKKYIAMLLCSVLVLSTFAACGNAGGSSSSSAVENTDASDPQDNPAANEPEVQGGEESSEEPTEGKAVTVGLIQLMEHPSLDEIRDAITGELGAKAGEYGLTVTVDYQNAQNDSSMINSICRQFVNDQVDAIIAIATPAAQGAATATSDIPIIFSAITDPIDAGLVEDLENPDGNITGTSDYIDVDKIFDLANQLTPGIQKYGFIYNKGETNSVSVIGQAGAYLESQGIAFEEKTVTSAGEVQQTARVLFETCDAVFAPIDNTVASAMQVLADEAIAAGKPVYVAADSMVADGGLATAGINYTNLGKQTADMALRAMSGTPTSDIPVEVLTETSVVINEETAEALGLDVSQYVQ